MGVSEPALRRGRHFVVRVTEGEEGGAGERRGARERSALQRPGRGVAGPRRASPNVQGREPNGRDARGLRALRGRRGRRPLGPGGAPGRSGGLVFLGDQWAGLDLLASPGLFATAWPRLCAGYAVDAIGSRESGTPAEGPEVILARLAAAPIEQAPAVGVGQEFRLVGGQVLGAALVVTDRLAHLAVFPAGGAD